MTVFNKPAFPEPPYTASVYFNYAAHVTGRQDVGNLQYAPELVDVMNVLSGNDVAASKHYQQATVDFFKRMSAVAAVVSDQPVGDFPCSFQPKNGKGLYVAPGAGFAESKLDLRFAVEDTLEGVTLSKQAGRTVLGVARDYRNPNGARGQLIKNLRETCFLVVSDVREIPDQLQYHIQHIYYGEHEKYIRETLNNSYLKKYIT